MNTSVSYIDFLEVSLTKYCTQYLANLVGFMKMIDSEKHNFLGLILTSSRLLSVLSLPKPCPVTIQKLAKGRIYRSYRSQCSALRNHRDHAQTFSCPIWASFKASSLAFAHTCFTSFPFPLSLLRA